MTTLRDCLDEVIGKGPGLFVRSYAIPGAYRKSEWEPDEFLTELQRESPGVLEMTPGANGSRVRVWVHILHPLWATGPLHEPSRSAWLRPSACARGFAPVRARYDPVKRRSPWAVPTAPRRGNAGYDPIYAVRSLSSRVKLPFKPRRRAPATGSPAIPKE